MALDTNIFYAVVGIGLTFFLWGVDKLFEALGHSYRVLKGILGVAFMAYGLYPCICWI